MNQAFTLGPSCSEGMVLQHSTRAVLWGWAEPGRVHSFSLAGHTCRATTGSDGRWSAVWNGLAAGGPHRLFHNDQILFEAVWIGDVWLCAGQSNMERSLEACEPWPADALGYRGDPGIRQLCLPNQFDFQTERQDIPGARWIGADTHEVVKISAVAFHFAHSLKQKTGIPQGLILAAVGGSTAQAWLPLADLRDFPVHEAQAKQFAQPGWLDGVQANEQARRNQWFESLEAQDPKDPQRAGSGPWRPVVLPAFARDLEIGDRTGSVWFRKQVTLGAEGGPGRLKLGTLVDSDDVWVNGQWVGSTAYQYPTRRYAIPEGILREGTNEILIRLVAPRSGLGATPDKVWRLEWRNTSVNLAGEWAWRPGASAPELAADTFLPLISVGLYNGLLAPLAPLGIRAVLWYQGESNLTGGQEYEALMAVLLARWRRLFGQPELPFVLVQLPLFGPEEGFRADEGWAWVRDAQRRLARLPGTALVVTLDAGEWNDIHPGNKRLVGERLALATRRLVLGEALDTWTGPLCLVSEREGKGLRIRFTQTGKGLSTRDGRPVRGFYLAGADGQFHPAEAEIDSDSVFVHSPLVADPLEVRYAWAANPGANLVNSLGIPASPFRQ